MNKKVWTVQRQAIGRHGEVAQEWGEDFATEAEALAQAQKDWDNLTETEHENNIIYVFEDSISQDEDRMSWHVGFNPVRTFTGEGEDR